MIEFRDFQHLLSLDEHRYFGRAASTIGLSQPALTKSLQRLEKELGVKLFDRSRARVTPTAVGQEVIARARNIVAGVAELTRSVDMMCGGEIGQLSVGVGPAMSESYVTLAIANIAQEHPRARIGVRVDHWRQLSDWLLAGELDLYVADITEAANDGRLLSTPLPTETFVWFCREGHPLALRQSVTRNDILKYPIATPKLPPWANRWFTTALGDDDGGNPSDSFATVECENYAMLKRIVLASDGISAALPSTIRAELDEGAVVALPLEAPDLKTAAGIVRLRDRTPSPLAEVLMREITKLASRSDVC